MSTSTAARTARTVTTREVRDFYQAKPERMARLSPEARKTVEPGARGSLHPEVIADHNRVRRTVTYTPGATKVAAAESKARAKALRDAAQAAGFQVGRRGRLPKAFLDTL